MIERKNVYTVRSIKRKTTGSIFSIDGGKNSSLRWISRISRVKLLSNVGCLRNLEEICTVAEKGIGVDLTISYNRISSSGGFEISIEINRDVGSTSIVYNEV